MTYSSFLNSKHAIGLNEGQLLFFREFLDSKRNLFLTGGAGVGKSFVVNRLSEFCDDNGVFISKTSSTGVSAINIGAQTLHSFMGIGLADSPTEILISKVRKNKTARERLRHCKILFIDEISMVSGELLDKVYAVLRDLCYKMPRIIIVGDFAQLAPVFKTDSLYAFESDSWNSLDFKTVHLTEIVRQDKESEFARLLSKIRFGDNSDISLLETRFITGDIPEGSMVAFSRNVDVDAYNYEKLGQIKGELKTYKAIDLGSDRYLDSLDKNCLAPKNLDLKVGAQVMLLKNDLDKGLSNGSIGKVVAMGMASVDVDFGGNITSIGQEEWKIEESSLSLSGKVSTKILASRRQVALKLCWASTIHKIQSLTVDKITLDLSGCFASGQYYCALSRAKTLEGLYIKGHSHSSLKVDPRCVEFYKNL